MAKKYEDAAQHLLQAIDIAVDVFKKAPPKNLGPNDLNQVINTYLEIRNNTQNPAPEFKKLSNLKYLENDAFTYFQEASGDAVNSFWAKIKEAGLPYQRENKLAKILQRGKIKNQIEYDYVIDTIVPFQQEGLLKDENVSQLNQMVEEFENKSIKKK